MAKVELNLISSSASSGLPADLDMTFGIPKEVLALREWVSWHQGITPFRDRLMVSKMSSEVPTIEKDLKRIMDTMNEALRKSSYRAVSDLDPPVLSVGIYSSPKVPQASMCYVEALYEEYKFRRPPAGIGQVSLYVTRRHIDMNAVWTRRPAKGRKFVWQYTKLPVSLMQKFPDLTLPRLWSYFPHQIIDIIEQEFRKSPFNKALELPHNKSVGKCTLDFESGEMYSTSEKKVYKIRCTTTDEENFLTCRMLGDSSYRSLGKHYQGAGILFYAFHPIIQEPVFLLGHMTYSSRCWSDFGGLKNFRERPKATAVRECYEESLGVLGSKQTLLEMLTNYKDNNVFKVVNENSCFVDHFVRVQYKDYPGYFRRERLDPRGHWDDHELEDVRWFSLSSLSGAIKNFTAQQTTVLAYPTFENGSLDILNPCPIRYELLQTLCIAEKLNFLYFIKMICKQHHIRDLLKSESETNLEEDSESTHQEEEKQKEQENSIPAKGGITLDKQVATMDLQVKNIHKDEAGLKEEDAEIQEANLEATPSCEEATGDGDWTNMEEASSCEEEAGDNGDPISEVKRIRKVFGKCEDKILLFGMGAGKFKW